MKAQLVPLILLGLLAGCSPHAGAYHAGARLVPGTEESQEPGYTLADIQQKLAEDNRTLTLESGGRFTWNTGSAVNKGTWRVEDGQLYLREDYNNDTYIQPALQKDRVWRVDPDGSLVNAGLYGAYNVEIVYTKP